MKDPFYILFLKAALRCSCQRQAELRSMFLHVQDSPSSNKTISLDGMRRIKDAAEKPRVFFPPFKISSAWQSNSFLTCPAALITCFYRDLPRLSNRMPLSRKVFHPVLGPYLPQNFPLPHFHPEFPTPRFPGMFFEPCCASRCGAR